jgi:hypothetical protein
MLILQCCGAVCALRNSTRRPHFQVIETCLWILPMITSFIFSSSFVAISLILLGALSFAGAVTV